MSGFFPGGSSSSDIFLQPLQPPCPSPTQNNGGPQMLSQESVAYAVSHVLGTG